MKKIKILLPIILVFVLSLALLCACDGGVDADEGKHKVKLSCTAGASVNGDNIIHVDDGADAVFDITIADGYVFDRVSAGSFDPESGRLTVPDVSSDLNIDFYVKASGTRMCGVSVLVDGTDAIYTTAVSVTVGSTTSIDYIIPRGYAVRETEGCSYSDGKITGIGASDALVHLYSLPQHTVSLYADGGFTVSRAWIDGYEQDYSSGVTEMVAYEGEDVIFELDVEDGWVISRVSEGSYNPTNGQLTVPGVSGDMSITVTTSVLDEELNKSYVYVFQKGYSGDTTSVMPGLDIRGNTETTLQANDYSRIFRGWTVGKSLGGGGQLIGTDRRLDLVINAGAANDDGEVIIYSNYDDADTIVYDANGGEINSSSANASATKYYSVSITGARLTLTYGERYLSFMEAASTFYDDGTFTRPGYVLKEYNTRADGSGTSYSIGSKAPLLDGSSDHPTLYCIWVEQTDPTDFTYEDHTLYCPVSYEKAPHWVESGIIITSYKGDDETVVIPEQIAGKTVIAIGAGAFTDKSVKTLVMGRRMLEVKDGAFVGCSSLETVYFPDGMYSMNNEALDEASYTSLKNLYVNATLAPRFVGADNGALSVKLSRLITDVNKPMVIVIAGSSSYQGLGTEYMEALLGGEYRVINFGTTRTTNGIIYLEAMAHLADENDIILYAPENSSYMMGEVELYWKTLRDLESMNNFWRYIDISEYSNVFGAFSEFNREYRYTDSYSPHAYEGICDNGSRKNDAYLSGGYSAYTTNEYGDCLYFKRASLSDTYIDTYYITMNEYMKSKDEGWWNDSENQENNKDYTDPNNITWANITDAYFRDQMNRAIGLAKSSGAKVYFSFCPVDEHALIDDARSEGWLLAYDAMILDSFDFDGIIGSSVDYVWDHSYFFDCAFHLNDTGRTFRTYQLYLDLCKVIGIDTPVGFTDVGDDFDGCVFENGSDGTPAVDWTPES